MPDTKHQFDMQMIHDVKNMRNRLMFNVILAMIGFCSVETITSQVVKCDIQNLTKT